MRQVARAGCSLRRTFTGSITHPNAFVTDASIPRAHREVIYELNQVISRGPVPVIQINKQLTDRCIGYLEECGGLTAFAQRYQKYLDIYKDSRGVNFLCSPKAPQTTKDMVAAELLALMRRLHGKDPSRVSELESSISPEVKRVLPRFGGSLTSFMLSMPSMFRLLRGGFVEATEGSQAQPLRGPKLRDVPAAPLAAASDAYDPAALRVFQVILPHVPFSYFIPISLLLECLNADEASAIASTAPNAPSLYAVLLHLPQSLVDIRLLGESEAETFIRLLGEGVAPTAAGLEHRGEERHSALQVLHLGPTLHRHLSTRDSVSISELPRILPVDLLRTLPLQGYASILIFDRLQHLFEVDVHTYVIKVRKSAAEFTLFSTPTPQVLRHVLETLRNAPALTLSALEKALPPALLSEMHAAFGTTAAFAAAHPLLLTFHQGNISTPLGRSAERSAAGASESDEKALAEAIARYLPEERAIHWFSFSHTLPAELRSSPVVVKEPREFFQRWPSVLAVHDPLWANGFLLSKPNVVPELGVHRPVEDMRGVLRQIAKVSVGGVDECSLMMLCSREVREVLKGLGGVEHVLSQLPEWFEVTNPTNQQGQCIVRYIGHLGTQNDSEKSETTTTSPPMAFYFHR